MTEEFDAFIEDIESTFFLYAHLSGAWELYMNVLRNPEIQKAYSKIMTGSEIEWKTIHRFMGENDNMVTWYPELPVSEIVKQQFVVAGRFYGVIITNMIGNLDYYLGSILCNRYGVQDFSGNSWPPFIREAGIDLHSLPNGDFVFTLIQERHKIEHNKARIDKRFIDRMGRKSIQHVYHIGDPIQKSHIDVLLTKQALVEFAENVDAEVENSTKTV
jgi:hypothetical protein